MRVPLRPVAPAVSLTALATSSPSQFSLEPWRSGSTYHVVTGSTLHASPRLLVRTRARRIPLPPSPAPSASTTPPSLASGLTAVLPSRHPPVYLSPTSHRPRRSLHLPFLRRLHLLPSSGVAPWLTLLPRRLAPPSSSPGPRRAVTFARIISLGVTSCPTVYLLTCAPLGCMCATDSSRGC